MKMSLILVIPVSLMLCVLPGSYAEDTTCPTGSIHCPADENVDCIPLSTVCDGKKDCEYGYDEDGNFCEEYKNSRNSWRSQCDRGFIQCTKYGVTECMTPHEYCHQEVPCDPVLDSRVCRVLVSGRLERLRHYGYHDDSDGPRRTNLHDSLNDGEEFLATSKVTLAHDDCPQLYTKVGDDCLSFLFPVNASWGVSKEFCNMIGGDLVSFRDLDHFTKIKNHLSTSMLTNDFWIGGRYSYGSGGHYYSGDMMSEEEEDTSPGWRWLDDSRIPIGFPMWAERYQENCRKNEVLSLRTNETYIMDNSTCYHYAQAPHQQDIRGPHPSESLCVAITYEHNFRFSDETCSHRKSPLCIAKK